MTGRVPAELWVAVVAAIGLVVGAVASQVRRLAPDLARRRLLAWLLAWLAVDVALGALDAFAAAADRPLPGIAAGIVVPFLGGLWLLGRRGRVSRLVAAAPLSSLIGVQVYRVAGAVFLLAWAEGRMPAAFALPAALGDLAVGLSAPLVAALVRRRSPRSRPIAVAWNAVGLADLVLAVTLGALTSPTPFQPIAVGHPNALISRLPFVLIPVFAVPLSLLLHAATLRRLREQAPGRAVGRISAAIP